jgi:hypothetical protein
MKTAKNGKTPTTPRYSVTRHGKMFHVFDRRRRRIVIRTASLEEAKRVQARKEKAEP